MDGRSTAVRRRWFGNGVCVFVLVVVLACVAWLVGGAEPGNAQPSGPPAATPCANTAAAKYNWGTPSREFDFSDPAALSDWWLYDAPGHAGNGRRTPNAVRVADGQVTITGDDVGNTGGMAPKGPGHVHGRWEICAKSTPVRDTYHSVLLLWPDAEDWPVGGEIDFMEIADPTRQRVEAYLHFDPKDLRVGGATDVDATQWHAWAVEWTPDRIATFVDGNLWWETTNSGDFPPRPMHLAMQLDDFGGDTSGGGQLAVDWVREYRLP